MKKLRVGVLMGGKSIEKEVSFNSGRTICDHLDTTRYEVIPLFQDDDGTLYKLPWHFLHRGKISDFQHRLINEATKISWNSLKTSIDFAYIAVHGRYAEDGTLQGFLEILDIPYLGSKTFGSALAMNKTMQKKFLHHAGIATAKSITLKPHEIKNFDLEKTIKKLKTKNINAPYVIKPNSQGSSFGVCIVNNNKDLEKHLKKTMVISKEIEQAVLIEKKLIGMEFSCTTITDYKTGKIQALPPTEIVPKDDTQFFDYTQKYMPGKAHKITPARCSNEILEEIKKTCIHVMKVLSLSNIARTDGFVTKDGNIIIIDPNTLTGMAPTSFLFREAAQIGMSHTHLINHLIETELKYYNMLENIEHYEKKDFLMNKKKLNVAVLFGGNTNEKEISLESGRNIIYKLSPQLYTPLPIFVSSDMKLYQLTQQQLISCSTKEIQKSLCNNQEISWDALPQLVDFVFIALHGGAGENGQIQGTLEMLGLPYNGSGVLASSLCANKYKANNFLQKEGFAVPQSLLLQKYEWQKNKKEILKTISEKFPLPLIVKPHDDGCSSFVEKINNKKDVEEKINSYFTHSNKKIALLEECIIGMELTVGVVGNQSAQALTPSQTVTEKDILSLEEKFLPGAGQNLTPAPVDKKTLLFIQKTIEKAYKVLGCSGYARIDCFYQNQKQSPSQKERVVILEINTLPGMTPATCLFHQAAEQNIKPMEFITNIINFGLQKHTKLCTNKVQTIEKNY